MGYCWDKNDISKVSTIGLPNRESIFYAGAGDKYANPALNSTASSLFCGLRLTTSELSDRQYNINNLKTACNGASSKKIDFNKGYDTAYELGISVNKTRSIG